MKPKKIANLFLTFISLISLTLVCTPSALAEDQVQHQIGIIDSLKSNLSTLCFYGEALLSQASYKLNHYSNVNTESENVTTQADLDFWSNLQVQYPFSEKPVFISKDSEGGLAYDYLSEGVTEATVLNNSEIALASYTVTKNETGFTIQKGAQDNPDQSYTIKLNKLEELEAIYGNIPEVQAAEKYIKEQIQAQA